MQTIAAPTVIDQNSFSVVLEIYRLALELGLISRAEADETAQRIASENELSPIFLW